MRLQAWARKLKRDIVIVCIASRDKRTPFVAKVVAAATAAYAFSPIDFIPDFIPIFGYLDDVLLVPVGIWLALHLIPKDLINEFRQKADEQAERPASIAAGIAIGIFWLLAIASSWWTWKYN
jgi:uncharacterized membrane protein YkvA (DUF1232 family)